MKMNLAFWKIGPLSIGLVLAAWAVNAQTLAKWTFEGNTAVPTLAQNVKVSDGLYDGAYFATWGTGTGVSWRSGGRMTTFPAGNGSATSISLNNFQNCPTGPTANEIRFSIKPNPGYKLNITQMLFSVKHQTRT